jgi:hypothetical protein
MNFYLKSKLKILGNALDDDVGKPLLMSGILQR